MSDIIYIGCRTTRERNARGEGLKVYRREDDDSFTLLQLLPMENPSYQCIDHRREFLYTVHGDRHEVSAFKILADGRLSFINTVSGLGRNPVFITIDKDNRFLYVASLQGGCVSVMERREDGGVQEPFFTAHLPGRTEDGVSHAHQCLWDGSGRYLFVPAQGRRIGYGEINVFRRNEDGTLTLTDRVMARELDEPRHAAIHPNNHWLYLLHERGNNVVFYRFDEETGKLTARQIVPCLPETYTGEGQASALLVDKTGRFLYASNRIHDSVTTFEIEPTTGYIRMTDNVSCLGRTPRFMTFSPDGEELIVENEDSDDIRFFSLDSRTGRLTAKPAVLFTESPVCLTYLHT